MSLPEDYRAAQMRNTARSMVMASVVLTMASAGIDEWSGNAHPFWMLPLAGICLVLSIMFFIKASLTRP